MPTLHHRAMLLLLLVLAAGIAIGAVAVLFLSVPLPAVHLPPFEGTLAFFKQLVALGTAVFVLLAVVLSA